jgi:hypothetical protein
MGSAVSHRLQWQQAGRQRLSQFTLITCRLPYACLLRQRSVLAARAGWQPVAPIVDNTYLGAGRQAVPLVGPPLQRLAVLQLSSCAAEAGGGEGQAK